MLYSKLVPFFAEITNKPPPPFEKRYPNRLESVLGSAEFATSYNKWDIVDLFSYYLVKIARRHAFLDANKRSAVAFSGSYLLLEGYVLLIDPQQLYVWTILITERKESDEDMIRFISFVLKSEGLVKKKE